MKLIASIIFLATSLVLTKAKLTVSQIIEVPMPGYMSHLFYFNDLLFGTVDMENGSNLGGAATLVQINDDGTMDQRFTFPITCTSLYCNVMVDYVDVEGALATFLVEADGCCASFHWVIVTVDLNNFKVVNHRSFDAEHLDVFPDGWIPIDGSSSLLVSKQRIGYQETEALVSMMSWENLRVNFTVYSPEQEYIMYGSGSGSGSIFAGGAPPYSNNQFWMMDPVSLKPLHKPMQVPGYPFVSVLPQQSFLIAAFANASDTSLWVWDITKPFPSYPDGVTIEIGAYPTDTLTDGNFAFIATRLWSNQSLSSLVQVDVTTTPFKVLDILEVPQPWLIANEGVVDITPFGVSQTKKRFAMVTLVQHNGALSGVIIVEYDSS